MNNRQLMNNLKIFLILLSAVSLAYSEPQKYDVLQSLVMEKYATDIIATSTKKDEKKEEQKPSWWTQQKSQWQELLIGKPAKETKVENYALNEHQIHQAVLNWGQTVGVQTTIDPYTFSELNIIQGPTSNKKINLADKINRCQTVFGYKVLNEMLANPTDNIETLIKRQNLIRYVAENKEPFIQLSDALKLVKNGQESLLLFYNAQNSLQEKAQDYYPEKYAPILKGQFKKINKNSTALQTAQYLTYLLYLRGCLPVGFEQSFTQTMVMYYYMKYFVNPLLHTFDPSSDAFNNIQIMKQQIASLNNPIVMSLTESFLPNVNKHESSFKQALRNAYENSIVKPHDPQIIHNRALFAKNTIDPKYGKPLLWSLTGFYDILWALRIKNSYDHVTNDKKVLDTLSKELSNIAQLFKGLKNLSKFAKANRDSFKHIDNIDYLINIFDKSQFQFKNIQKLNGLLKANIFNPERFSVTLLSAGQILAAFKLLEECKDQLIPALNVIGQIDVAVNGAQLVKEFANQKVKYCFAEFVNSDKPFVKIENGWTPLIDTHKVVSQNFDFGSGSLQSMMLTGPNGCGKSTIIKTLAHVILIAQTFGIAPADSVTLTPFARIMTAISVKEDLGNNMSTFMAQQYRMESIKTEVQNLNNQKHNLVLVDEGFSGTTELLGAQLFYDFGQGIISNNNISLLATHFEKPAYLEKDTNGVYKNYHVELLEPATGQFVRTFKLVEGANNWWFNDKEKASRFANWLKEIGQA
ncbi:hypothetical protein M1446_03475 [Candidatus Dependentiae bacterium]|nr:hypothetical protein [Candidatus Dependentiae bacterium]